MSNSMPPLPDSFKTDLLNGRKGERPVATQSAIVPKHDPDAELEAFARAMPPPTRCNKCSGERSIVQTKDGAGWSASITLTAYCPRCKSNGQYRTADTARKAAR